MRQPSWVWPVVSSLLLTGCAVGPNYKRPQAAVPTQWTVAPARGTETKSPETDEWWASFQDPELNSLVERSASRNLDLKLALERVQEARAWRCSVGLFSFDRRCRLRHSQPPEGHRASRTAKFSRYRSGRVQQFSRRPFRFLGIGCLWRNPTARAGGRSGRNGCRREPPRCSRDPLGRCWPGLCAIARFPAPA